MEFMFDSKASPIVKYTPKNHDIDSLIDVITVFQNRNDVSIDQMNGFFAPKKGKHHVIRGGAWNSLPVYLRSSSRYGDSDAKDYYGIGCRCAKSAD